MRCGKLTNELSGQFWVAFQGQNQPFHRLSPTFGNSNMEMNDRSVSERPILVNFQWSSDGAQNGGTIYLSRLAAFTL